MNEFHERRCTPDAGHSSATTIPTIQTTTPTTTTATTTRVITIAIKGSDKFPPPKTKERLELLHRIVVALLVKDDLPEVDVLLLPGGFFRIKRSIALASNKKRFSRFAQTELALEINAFAQTLDEHWPGVTLILGIDSDAVSKTIGGDQLVGVWQQGKLASLVRKAFPVDGDTNGQRTARKEPVFFVVPEDSNDPARIITLRNGAKALILSCYDAFAVRALYGRRHADLTAIRLMLRAKGNIGPPSFEQKRDHIKRWLAMLDAHPPDLALIAIHRFRQPGQDGYWQRHGIAGASAALQGAAVIGAAHFRSSLPAAVHTSPLAARDVPLTHLNEGAKRKAHRFLPDYGFTLRNEHGEPIALIRLFTLHHNSKAGRPQTTGMSKITDRTKTTDGSQTADRTKSEENSHE